MAGETSRENGKKGGRPKGSKNPETLEREAVMKAYRERILINAQEIFSLQMQNARGCTYLYKTQCTGRGKDRKCKYMQVTDPEEIENYLNGLYDEVDRGSGVDEGYYQITVDKPDNKSLYSMLDRAFGKAPQSLDLTSKGESMQPLIVEIIRKGDEGK
jgi:hypothetical protein